MPKIRDFDPLKKRPLKTFEDRDVAPLHPKIPREAASENAHERRYRKAPQGNDFSFVLVNEGSQAPATPGAGAQAAIRVVDLLSMASGLHWTATEVRRTKQPFSHTGSASRKDRAGGLRRGRGAGLGQDAVRRGAGGGPRPRGLVGVQQHGGAGPRGAKRRDPLNARAELSSRSSREEKQAEQPRRRFWRACCAARPARTRCQQAKARQKLTDRSRKHGCTVLQANAKSLDGSQQNTWVCCTATVEVAFAHRALFEPIGLGYPRGAVGWIRDFAGNPTMYDGLQLGCRGLARMAYPP